MDQLVQEGIAKRRAKAAGREGPEEDSTPLQFDAGVYQKALKADKFSFFRDRDTEPDEAESFKKFGGKKSNFSDANTAPKASSSSRPVDSRQDKPRRSRSREKRKHSRSRSRERRRSADRHDKHLKH